MLYNLIVLPTESRYPQDEGRLKALTDEIKQWTSKRSNYEHPSTRPAPLSLEHHMIDDTDAEQAYQSSPSSSTQRSILAGPRPTPSSNPVSANASLSRDEEYFDPEASSDDDDEYSDVEGDAYADPYVAESSSQPFVPIQAAQPTHLPPNWYPPAGPSYQRQPLNPSPPAYPLLPISQPYPAGYGPPAAQFQHPASYPSQMVDLNQGFAYAPAPQQQNLPISHMPSMLPRSHP